MGTTGWILAVWLLPGAAAQEDPASLDDVQIENRVAVPRIRSKATGLRRSLGVSFQQGLIEEGLTVVQGRSLQQAARNVESSPRSLDAAMEAGCGYLVRLSLRRTRRQWVVAGELLHESSEQVGQVERRFGSRKRTTRKQAAIAGRELAQTVAELIRADQNQRKPPEPVPVPDIQMDDTPPGPEGSSDQGAFLRESTPVARSVSVSPKQYQFGAGVGSRLRTSSVLSSRGQSSQLSYDLDPLVAVGLSIRLRPLPIPLVLEAKGAWSPVGFELGVDPQQFDTEASGSFGWVSTTLGYEIDLFAQDETSFSVQPLLGGGFVGLDVDSQVVVGWSAWSLHTGLEFGFRHRGLEVLARAQGGPILNFSESESGASGDPTSGFRFGGGGEVRLWLSSLFGVALELNYDQLNQRFDGTGERFRFMSDPELIKARYDIQATDLLLSAIVGFDG